MELAGGGGGVVWGGVGRCGVVWVVKGVWAVRFGRGSAGQDGVGCGSIWFGWVGFRGVRVSVHTSYPTPNFPLPTAGSGKLESA